MLVSAIQKKVSIRYSFHFAIMQSDYFEFGYIFNIYVTQKKQNSWTLNMRDSIILGTSDDIFLDIYMRLSEYCQKFKHMST